MSSRKRKPSSYYTTGRVAEKRNIKRKQPEPTGRAV